jgi:hypothetical protein
MEICSENNNIVGYYTNNTCVPGTAPDSNSSISKIVMEDENGMPHIISPPLSRENVRTIDEPIENECTSLSNLNDIAADPNFKINAKQLHVITHPFYYVYNRDLPISFGIAYDQADKYKKLSPTDVMHKALSEFYKYRSIDIKHSKTMLKYAFEIMKTISYLKVVAKSENPVIFLLDESRTSPGAKQFVSSMFSDKSNTYFVYTRPGDGSLWRREEILFRRIISPETQIELSGSIFNLCVQITFSVLRKLGLNNVDCREDYSYHTTNVEAHEDFNRIYYEALLNYDPLNPEDIFSKQLQEEYTNLVIKS